MHEWFRCREDPEVTPLQRNVTNLHRPDILDHRPCILRRKEYSKPRELAYGTLLKGIQVSLCTAVQVPEKGRDDGPFFLIIDQQTVYKQERHPCS